MMRTVLFLSLVVACGDKPSDIDSAGPGECYERQGDNGYPELVSCELPSPCDDVVFNLSDDVCGSSTYDPAAAQCVLDALAAGTVGTFGVRDCPGGQYSESWWLQSLGDGTVIWATNRWDDSVGESRGSWRALPDSSTFTGCDASTPETFLACIEAIEATACQTGTPSCP